VTKYYAFGAQRVAMRQCNGSGCADAMYLHGDHPSLRSGQALGSVSLVTDSTGNMVSQARYTPYGEQRWPAVSQSPTDFGYTGQRADSFGLMDYNARFYSPHLGRFISADSIIPNPAKAVSLDRFAYGDSNPLIYTDPTGHCAEKDDACWNKLKELEETYGIDIDTENYGEDGVEIWDLVSLFYLHIALERMVGLIGTDAFTEMIGGAVFRLDSTLKDVGKYDAVGKNRLDDSRVISLKPGFYKSESGGYKDGWSPVIHEMWHGVDDWVSKVIYDEKSPTYFSRHDYATMTGVGPPCTPNCDWNQYAWEDRPFEDFAVIGTLVTNIAADRTSYGAVNEHPNEYWRIYTFVRFVQSWVSQ
jgi:RHS repeat-associated protein